MEPLNLDRLADEALVLAYEGLWCLVRSDVCRRHLHNCDPGHPFYTSIASGSPIAAAEKTVGSSSLFMFGQTVHDECIRRSPLCFDRDVAVSSSGAWFSNDFVPVFSSLEKFCETIVAHTPRFQPR